MLKHHIIYCSWLVESKSACTAEIVQSLEEKECPVCGLLLPGGSVQCTTLVQSVGGRAEKYSVRGKSCKERRKRPNDIRGWPTSTKASTTLINKSTTLNYVSFAHLPGKLFVS